MLNFNFINEISEDYPIIIKPNLGNPSIFNLRNYENKDENAIEDIVLDTIFLGKLNLSIEKARKIISKNIYIQPILKEFGPFEERRGERFQLELISLSKIIINPKKFDYNDKELVEIRDIYNTLKKNRKALKKRKRLFKITFRFKNISSIRILLEKTNTTFILFDIIQNFPIENKNRIAFHSLALYNKNWKDFNFIHATDPHVARRNDHIFQFLKQKSQGNKIKKKRKKTIIYDPRFLQREFEFREGFQNNKFQEPRHGMYNFNNNLRNFISFVNDKVKKKELDFVLLTGDLIDYVNLANIDSIYKNNYQVFLDIILGIDRESKEKQDQILNKKEILAPIFTILGNHDFRLGHYSIRTGNMFRIFGLIKKDIRGYKDDKLFYGIKALYSKVKFIHNYFLFINPNRNFRINIGSKYSFIFLDSGSDSIANLFGLIRGAPSTRGLNKRQIKLLKHNINQSSDKHIVLLMHAPPVSPKFTKKKKKKLKKKFGLVRNIEWHDFYEENLEKHTGSNRLESHLNLKDQTLMYRWSKLMRILSGSDKDVDRKIDLVLCGHSHTLKEFRLKEAKKSEMIRVNMGFYFIPIYIQIPCRIYTNCYRNIIKHFCNELDIKGWFDANKPFVLHTQGLGPLSYKMKAKAPGFRYIIVKNNQITDFSVFSLYLK
ncbi:MAG: metallophosphoesterase [Candidatus Lokiarchaeota archaeon]|nr:metallophosphoesterase [Candidatus Lokiarchaeota archaeon]